jgi:hypothetical protein
VTLNSLALAITKREGKKQSVNIAQVKEILGVIVELGVEDMLNHVWEDKKGNVLASPVFCMPALVLNEAADKKVASALKKIKKQRLKK